MILLWIAISAWSFAIVGFGRWCRSAPALRFANASITWSAVVGLATVQTIAILWNFVAPISAGFAGTVLMLGWCGLAIPERVGGPRLDRSRAAAMASVAAALSPLLTLRVHYLHDVGMYSLPIVRWAQASALPLGLANLNPRYGFNSGWFALDALLRRPLLPLDALPSIAPAVMITLVLGFGVGALRELPGQLRRNAAGLAAVAIVLLLGTQIASSGLNSPASDLPVMVGWAAVALLSLRGFAGRETAAADFMAVALLAGLTITAKLSALPILVLPAVVAWRMKIPRAALFAAAGLLALVLVPWLARGFWTSGCFAFPSVSSCLPHVWWSTPLDQVGEEAMNVANWAREPFWKAGGVRPDWFVPWLERTVRSPELQVPAVVALGAWAFGRRGESFVTRASGIALGCAAAAQVVLIAFVAPDPRFVAGPLWVLAFAFAWDRMRSATRRGSMAFVAALVVLVPALSRGWLDLSRGIRHAGDAPAAWVAPPILDRDLPFTWMTVDGGRIRIAAQEMKPAPACWAIEVPCAPWPPAGLRVHSSGTGTTGFSIPGAPPGTKVP